MILVDSCFIQTEILWSPVKTNCPTDRREGDASATRTQDTFDDHHDDDHNDDNDNRNDDDDPDHDDHDNDDGDDNVDDDWGPCDVKPQ